MATDPPAPDPEPIRLVLTDVDGTLVTPDKVLTDGAVEAVGRLRDAGVAFAVTSGRPPRGMEMLVGPLALTTPIAAFNGGLYVDDSMQVVEQHALPATCVGPVIDLLEGAGLDVWVYRGAEWLVRDPSAPHVDREAWTVKFDPTVVPDFAAVAAGEGGGVGGGVAKIVGVSDDVGLVASTEEQARDRFGRHVSAARSQPYYLDVTHPDANKGGVVRYLSNRYGIPPSAVATLGDMPNDVLMFAHSGMSIAMGNADREVQRAARHVTASNEDEGFARAIEHYVLPTTKGTSR
jgi:Cof subfamily protein (haloacid dehalogenase superfamily)